MFSITVSMKRDGLKNYLVVVQTAPIPDNNKRAQPSSCSCHRRDVSNSATQPLRGLGYLLHRHDFWCVVKPNIKGALLRGKNSVNFEVTVVYILY